MKIIKIKFFKSRPTDKRTSATVWAIILTTLFLFSLLKKLILPEYFFFDERTISNFMALSPRFQFAESYSSTAAFYNLFGAQTNSIIFELITTTFILSVFIFYFSKSKAVSLSFFELSLFTFLAFLSCIYMTVLSKDLIVFLVISPFIFFLRMGIGGLFAWTLLAGLYAIFFRSYWFIFLAEFWMVFILLRWIRSWVLFIAAIPLSLFALSIVFNQVLGVELDSFRTAVNDIRLESQDQNAQTIILPWISGGGTVVGWLNSVITLLTLLIPLPLFLMLSPYYIVIATFISYLSYYLWRATLFELKIKTSIEMPACCALVISFITIQSIFEPDYGSYVRHLAPFYPIILFVILKNSNRAQNNFKLSTIKHNNLLKTRDLKCE